VTEPVPAGSIERAWRARGIDPSAVSWSTVHEVLPGGGRWAELDEAGASGPCVLERDDGSARMWYTGDDGSTARILVATSRPDGTWERQGIAVDAGSAGDTDAYGVDSPCVIPTSAGYLMAYGGSDGADTRLHMATSPDGQRWESHGTCMQRGEADAVGATHPCLVVVGRQWWLFYAGYDGTANGRRARILAAVSATGASWDRVGPVLEPAPEELAVCEPWVVVWHGSFHMFYVSDDDSQTRIALATSADGLAWDRRGITVAPLHDGERGVRSPCVARRRDGALRLWYAAPSSSAPAAPDRICMVEATGFAL
jgi:predicted GH43/DUF377 family glycosyl hydrolase